MALKIKRGPKFAIFGLLGVGLFFGVRHFLPAQDGGPSDTKTVAVVDAGPAPVAANVIQMTGSSTIGQSLAPKLVEAYLSKLGLSPTETPDATHERTVVTAPGYEVDISYPGSGAAFDCLANHTCDIGLSSRGIEPQEEAKLASVGNMHTSMTEHVLAMDGIAVIVNPSNPVTQLTVAQIFQLFTGQARDWAQVGGIHFPVHVYSRDTKSGTYDSFVHMALGGTPIPTLGPILNDNESVTKNVSTDPYGVGFVGLAYLQGVKAVSVQSGNATPLAPSYFTVSTEDYAFARRLYLYTAPTSKAFVTPFLSFALSEEGQRIVSQVGFVPLSVNATVAALPTNAPPSYVSTTRGSKRLSFDFRFDFGGANLDGKAMADLSRMADYLHSNPASKVTLLGFADNQGAESANVQISKLRAQTVAGQLQSMGIAAQVVSGFGSAMPVASNDTPDGRARNRRVEVWVN